MDFRVCIDGKWFPGSTPEERARALRPVALSWLQNYKAWLDRAERSGVRFTSQEAARWAFIQSLSARKRDKLAALSLRYFEYDALTLGEDCYRAPTLPDSVD